MKQMAKKLGSVFLTLCLVLTLLPTVAFAADANNLKSPIENYSSDLSATVTQDTVTVTGTVTNAALPLVLDIDAGVTVIWKATLTSAADFTGNLLTLKGEGTFEVAEGGTVSSATSSTIFNESTGRITVSGGMVFSTTGFAIYNSSTGVVRVSGDAIIQNNSDVCPTIQQSNGGSDTDTTDRIVIEGGTVKNDGNFHAICNFSIGGVTVSGGTVSATTASAIYNESTGVIKVSGDAIIQNNSNSTIEATINQRYSGTDTADRIIIEGGTVENSGTGCAIYNASTGGVTVSGGMVSSTTGNAISNGSTGGVAVSGGMVSSTTGIAIYNASTGVIRVSGDAIVQNNSNAQNTINQYNFGTDTANRIIIEGGTVKNDGNKSAIFNDSTGGVAVSGGTVASTTGIAISNSSTGGVTVSGGIVLARGLAFSNIISVGSSGFTESSITDTGVMIAVASDAFITGQSNGAKTNLNLWKVGGKEALVTSAEWAKQGDLCGLLVTSFEPDVFVLLTGVIVVLTPKSTDFTAPTSLVYDGTAKAYTMPSDMDASIFYEGTGTTSYIKSSTAPTDAGTYNVMANVVKNDAYCAATNLVIGTMTIQSKTLTESMIGEIVAQNYTGGQITPTITVTDGTELVKDTDYTVSYGVNCTVVAGGTVTVSGKGNYTGSATKNFTVSPAALTITAATVEAKSYDGTTTATVTGVTLSGDVDSMAMGTDFTAAGTFDNANVGSVRNVTITVTLVNTDKAKNYIVSGNYMLTGQTIEKGIAPTVADDAISHRNTVTDEKTVAIAALVPSDAGTASFTAGLETDSNNIIGDWSVNSSGTVTYTLNGGAIGDTATLPIIVSTLNCQDFTINVVITLTDKDYPLASIDNISAVYGESLVIQGTATFNSSPVAGTWNFVTDTSGLTIGSNAVTVKFTPTDTDTYTEVTKVITVTLSKATPTGAPKYTTITANEKTLANAGLTTEGGTFSVSGTVAWVLTSTTAVQKNTAYAWLFTPTDSTRYNTLSGSITLYPYSSGGSSSSGRRGSGTATPSTTVSGCTAITTATAKTGSDGKTAASVTKSQMSGAIEAAQKAAKNTGKAPRVEIQVFGASNVSATETTLPKAAVQALVTGEMESLTLSSPMATMNFDAQAIATIAGAASSDVEFTASNVKNSTLSDLARQVVGDRPVYDFSVTSGDKTISQFDGTVTLSLPYTPAAGEDVDAIVAYYINADGEPELMQNCYYDAKAGALVFITTHFSQYAVGYNKVSFSDVADTAWYADAVSYLAARGITGGTAETTFGPDAMLTRGQLITLLMRAYGIDADENPMDNFADAGNTYYTGYLAEAKRLEISSGVGDNKFAPEQAVTRQEMFTLLYNALKAIDQLPEGNCGKTLSDFSDSGTISSYAQEAMGCLVKVGTVGGNNGQLNPTDTTSRAQMAQVLYNLLAK